MAENKNNSSDIILYSSPEGNIKAEGGNFSYFQNGNNYKQNN